MLKLMIPTALTILLLASASTSQANSAHSGVGKDLTCNVLPNKKLLDGDYNTDCPIPDHTLPELSKLSLIAVGISLVGLRLRRKS